MTESNKRLSAEEYNKQCSEYIPIGVWIFWGLAGCVLLGWLATRYATVSNTLSVVINLGASIGALAAAYATFKTVREMQAGRKEDRMYRRPRFVFVSGEIGLTTQAENSDYLSITCKQVGLNPAATVSATAAVVCFGDYGDVVTKAATLRPANSIGQDSELSFSMAGPWLLHPGEIHHVEFEIRYFDVFSREPLDIKMYFTWSGLEPDEIKAQLYDADRSLIPRIRYVLSL